MYGRGVGAVRIGGGGAASDNMAPISTPSATPSTRAPVASYHNSLVSALVVLLVAYVVWAMVETHEKVRASIEPKNMVFNLRTILLVTFTAILGINILRVLFAKLAALGVPGMAQLLVIVGNA